MVALRPGTDRLRVLSFVALLVYPFLEFLASHRYNPVAPESLVIIGVLVLVSLAMGAWPRSDASFYVLLVSVLSLLSVPYLKHVVPVLATTNPYYLLAGSATLLALAAYQLRERFLVVLVVSLSACFLYGSVEGAMHPSLAVQQSDPELSFRGMHFTPETPTYSMRGCGGLPADAGGV